MAPPSTFLAILASVSLVDAQTCFYPGGKEAVDDIPCRTDTDASACCAAGYMCISNGLCQSTGEANTGNFARGSCTQQDWDSTDCPNYCIEESTGGGADVTRCQGYTDRYFCPASSNAKEACNDSDKYLVIQGSSTFTTIGEEQASTRQASTTRETGESTTTKSSESKATTASEEATSSSQSSSPAQTETGNEGSDSGSNSNSAVIGGAVGGSLGGILLGAAGVWFLMRYRRRRKAAVEDAVPQYRAHEIGAGGVYGQSPMTKYEMPTESPPVELPGHSPNVR
ncbi:hypothetical protein FDECE_8222 [Fusarium decemcellulare]|nr:hypothetical protein FDECE_8222 [Fusarium decemcellulare]